MTAFSAYSIKKGINASHKAKIENKRTIKVDRKGKILNIKFEGSDYYVSIKSVVIIRMIQIKLKTIRLLRSRKYFGVESIVLLLTMTAIWMLCALAIYTVEDKYLDGTTLSACLWSLKEEYISTVVIVIAMRVCSNVWENEKN